MAAAHEEALADGHLFYFPYLSSCVLMYLIALSASYLVRGPVSKHASTIPPRCQKALATFYNNLQVYPPAPKTYLALDMTAPRGAVFLFRAATFYCHIICAGRRFTTTHRDGDSELRTAHSALVKVRINDTWLYGEILTIFEHIQPGHLPTLFAEMLWFNTLEDLDAPTISQIWESLYVPSTSLPLANPKSSRSPELDIKFHLLGQYADLDSTLAAIPLHNIHCHLARGALHHIETPLWVTTTLDKVYYSTYDRHTIQRYSLLQMSAVLN